MALRGEVRICQISPKFSVCYLLQVKYGEGVAPQTTLFIVVAGNFWGET